MARYKLIRPTFEDPQFKHAKKRARIIGIVTGIWSVLVVVGICIGGLHQDDDLVTGWGVLALGLITLVFTLFCIYTIIAKWEPLFWGDCAETWRYLTKKEREKRVAQYCVEFGIIVAILGVMAVAMIIAGTVRLLEVS